MVQHPFLRGLRAPLLIAHRGGAKLAPENTLTAFRMAVERFGASMLEIDVHATRDGELVVSHDALVDRCTEAAGAIADMTLSEVSKLDAGYRFSPDGGRTWPFRGAGIRIPSLEEVLSAFPGTLFNIDIKAHDHGVAPLLAGLLRSLKAVSRTCCGSVRDDVARRLRAVLPEGCQFFPPRAAARFLLLSLAGMRPTPEPCYQVLDVPYRYKGLRVLNQRVMARAREHGLWINVFTIDDPMDMRSLLRLGVGGIMTDRPDTCRQVMQSPRGY